MADQWYYSEHDQQRGPVDQQTLLDMLRSGRLPPAALVWTEGMQDWQPANQVPALGMPAQAPRPGTPSQSPPPGNVGYNPRPLSYQAPLPPGAGDKTYYNKALTGFILSLVGLLCCAPIGIAGIVMGVNAMNGMKQSLNSRGYGLAVAAVVIGIIGLLIFAIRLTVELN